jgi:hypothetical protein
MSDRQHEIRAAARRIWLHAWLTDGHIVIPENQQSSLATALLVAAVTDTAIDHGSRIDWVEHPSGWVGEMTPMVPS